MKELRKEKGKEEEESANIKVEVMKAVRFILPLVPVSAIFVAVVFAIFMYARTMKDERLSGFFGLAPIFLLILVFWGWFIISLAKGREGKSRITVSEKQAKPQQ